LLAVVVFLQ